MDTTHQDISQLLHDASLASLVWEPDLDQVNLAFDCLRRHVDGSKMSDPSVTLRLHGVDRIAAYYSPATIEVRPSQFVVKNPLAADDLNDLARSWDK